jgi:hypothetical protein
MTSFEERVWEIHMKSPHLGASQIALIVDAEHSEVSAVLNKRGTPPEKPERVRLLEKGLELTTGDRDKTYGPPWDNLTACAMLWEAYLSAKLNQDIRLVAEDVAHMMQLVKMTRTFHGSYHADNYLDNAVYGAIAGECRQYEEKG